MCRRRSAARTNNDVEHSGIVRLLLCDLDLHKQLKRRYDQPVRSTVWEIRDFYSILQPLSGGLTLSRRPTKRMRKSSMYAAYATKRGLP